MKSIEKIEVVDIEKVKKVRKPKVVKEFEGVTQEQLDKSLETQFYYIKEELQEFKVNMYSYLRSELSFNEGRLFNGLNKRTNNDSTEILIKIDELINKLGDTN